MAVFEVVRHSSLSASTTWRRLTDWPGHGAFIPLTEVHVTSQSDAVIGTVFTARTALGRFHFDDPMEITHWQPPSSDQPGRCRLVKQGRVVTGWAVLTVTPTAEGSTIHWLEDAHVRAVGPLLDLPNRVAGRIVFGRLVDGLLATEEG